MTKYENNHGQALNTTKKNRYLLFKINCKLPSKYIKTTGIKKNIAHHIPAPVEAVLDKLFELSFAKLAISSINIVIINTSINDANTNVSTYGHERRQRISLVDNRGRS